MMMIWIKRTIGLAVTPAVAVLAAAGAAVGLAAGDAAAQSSFTPGFYAAGFGGGSVSTNQDMINAAGTAKFDVDFNAGLVVGAAAGYRFSRSLRLELESAYRQHGVGEVASLGTPSINASGDISAWSGMLNGYLDFGESQLRPYVGLGFGFASVGVEKVKATDSAGSLEVDDRDTVLAFQTMAGAAYRLTEEWGLFGEYRFFAADSINAAGTPKKIDYRSHNFQIGGRYDF